jgi:hypothetical protein
MLAKAKAPPPNIPAHKHVMINRSLADASAKRSNGIAAQRLPSSNAFPMARLTARFDTVIGFGMRFRLDLIPKNIA